MAKRKSYYLYSYNYTSSKLFLYCNLLRTLFLESCKMPLYTYYYKIIRYLYSYSYTLTNFGLLLAFIGLFLYRIICAECIFAI